MRNIKCIVQYDGTNYSGWQIQPNSISIQETIEEKLTGILKEKVSIITAGRTDKGVHAIANVFNFNTEKSIPAEKVAVALNSLLPGDIYIIDSEEVDINFHSRYSAKWRTYEYKICLNAYSPFLRNYRWFLHYNIDIEKMIESSKYLIGKHDFSSFRSSSCGAKNPVREIKNIDINKKENTITIEITANAFLKNMVRIITGTFIEIGTGKIEPAYMQKIIADKDRTKVSKTAPPQGLFLKKIIY